jgi:hypothetical protein
MADYCRQCSQDISVAVCAKHTTEITEMSGLANGCWVCETWRLWEISQMAEELLDHKHAAAAEIRELRERVQELEGKLGQPSGNPGRFDAPDDEPAEEAGP